MALTLLLAGKRLGDKEDNERALVADAAVSAAAQVDAFLDRHAAGIRSAAEAIALDGRPSADRLGQWLLRYHPIYPDFLTMLVADSSGQVVTASKPESGQPALVTSSDNVSDRAYFRTPMSTRGDYVSPAFQGRGLGTDPLVAISSLIEVGGRKIGIVEGSLNLMAFKRLDTSYQHRALLRGLSTI